MSTQQREKDGTYAANTSSQFSGALVTFTYDAVPFVLSIEQLSETNKEPDEMIQLTF
jgi:hypothetical protein